MSNEKLNNLAASYVVDKSQEIFSEIYSLLTQKWRPTYGAIARSLRTETDEVEELYEDTLMRVLERYDGSGKFERNLSRALKNARIDFIRSDKRLRSREQLIIDGERGEGTAIPELEYAVDAEDEARQKKEDQLQLISFLLQNADSETTAIISEFGNYESPNALAKAMGIHHEVVKRKLRKLAKSHDASIFGDYRQYLTA
jgi:DNA-directed RNA polymerase specialized sigma24 family protein